MTDSEAPLPGWLLAMSWMVFFGTLFIFGITVFLIPLDAFSEGGEGAEFPARFMAIRHMAFALPLLHGILKKDRTVLRTMYLIFLVMSVLDVVTLFAYDYYIPFVGPDALSRWTTGVLALVMFSIPMAVAVSVLSGKKSAV